jgi:hypothetical protein
MKQVIFESSPVFIVLCLAVGVGYALLLYRSKNPWGKALNRALFFLRAVVTFFLAFFLLGPIVKQVSNVFEKPVFILLQDNSVSVRETTDSLTRTAVANQITALRTSLDEKGYEAVITNFDEDGVDHQYQGQVTNIHEALRMLSNRYEGRSLEGVVLVSDGIYNAGLSPLYGSYNFPVYSVGVGDTTERADLLIKNLVYNKIAYQGNRFPLRAEIGVKGYPDESVSVSLSHKGTVIDRQTKTSSAAGLLTFEFQPLAGEEGIQRYDVQVEVKPGERNTRNNRASVFIEVVEGKKKILMVSSAPHPDVKTLRAVIEQNSNFEFILHVPGIEETLAQNLQPENIDLAVFHQVPDVRGRTRELFQRFSRSRTSMFLVLGQASDLGQIAQQQMPLGFEQLPRQYDEVTPVMNTAFSNFITSTEANSVFAGYPPVQVHFGKLLIPGTATPLLFQRVGSLTTDKPLLYIQTEDARKIAIMLGEGFWRWRLHEFSRTEKTEAFDEIFGKLIQYLSASDEKSKFRSYTVQQQFSDTEPVLFESQVYNDIFEPIYGNTIEIELTDEQGKVSRFSYITSPGNSRYPIGGLKEGVYRYRSSTVISDQREEVRGQFMVVAQQLELQNLTADFDLLRKLSSQTGGTFFSANRFPALEQVLTAKEARSLIRSEERYDSLINLKWIFFMLLLLVSAEWFLRKYYGSY